MAQKSKLFRSHPTGAHAAAPRCVPQTAGCGLWQGCGAFLDG